MFKFHAHIRKAIYKISFLSYMVQIVAHTTTASFIPPLPIPQLFFQIMLKA